MGKIKTYKANTNVSINVVLASKKNLHISFSPLSDGSSTFTTDNKEVMNAIEQHYQFGKLFRLHSQQGENKPKPSKTVNHPAKEEETSAADANDKTEAQAGVTTEADEVTDTEQEDNKPALKQVKVSDFAAAKDYLADTFCISRTALRSMKAITEQAAANGIEFVGLE